MPALKKLDLKKTPPSVPSPPTSSNIQKPLPLLKPQLTLVKATPPPRNVTMPQLHKLQTQPLASNSKATPTTGAGKSRKRKQKHQ